MTVPNAGEDWQVRVLGPRFPWGARPPRPAEVGESLRSVILAPEHLLEDAEYNKILPNRYIIELNQSHYARYYQPIEEQVLRQWQNLLLEHLNTANSRQGRREYRLAGRLQIEIRPVQDLSATQIRILSRFEPDESGPLAAPTLPACLELLPAGQRWSLRPGVVTLGRNENCDVVLNMPEVSEKRLVSGWHAYIRYRDGQYRLFDGAVDGKPSTNGTYINYQRVAPGGHLLQDGDTVILAAIDPDRPRTDTPGVAAFRFHLDCP